MARSSAAKTGRHYRLRQGGLLLVAVVGVGLFAYGGQGFLKQYHATHNPHPTITKTIITHSNDTPDETKPTDACTAYRAAPTHPERIDISSINAHGCIEQVGINQKGAIAVPDNIYAAAWYVNSVLPGHPGLSVILGHISGRYNVDGIFQHLDQLKAGDSFTVTLGSGKLLHYRVFRTQSIPTDDAVRTLLTKDPITASQLNLITCGGHYDKAAKLYDHRIIVSAALLS